MSKQVKTNDVSLASSAEVLMDQARQKSLEKQQTIANDIATGLTKSLKLKGNQANIVTNAFTSVLLSRSELAARAGLSFGGKRDLYSLCGYPPILRSAELGVRYERQDIAKRIVDAYPKAAWRVPPLVTEDEDDSTNTPFEDTWNSIVKTCKLYNYLARVDRLSGIGQYSVLLLGFNDGLPLDQPVKLAKNYASTTKATTKLLYLQPYGELDSQIIEWEGDISNERYGLPVRYNVMVRMANNQSGFAQQVHWTRILHVAQDALMSDVFGTPILKAVYNRLQDLDTIVAGSSEMFWRGGWPGLALEADPTMSMEQSAKAVQEEAENYLMGMSRLLKLQGIKANQLSPNIADPSTHVDMILKLISGTTGIPLRILTGSEMGQLASTQDRENWNSRVHEYQMTHCEPNILRPLIQRLILAGSLPCPQEREEDGDPKILINWEDQGTLGAEELAKVALVKTQAMSAYIGGGVDAIMAPKNYLIEVLGYSKDESEAMLDEAEQNLTDQEEENIQKAAAQQDQVDEDGNPLPMNTRTFDNAGGGGVAAGTTGQMASAPGGDGAGNGKIGSPAGKNAPKTKKGSVAAPTAGPQSKTPKVTIKVHGGPGSGPRPGGGHDPEAFKQATNPVRKRALLGEKVVYLGDKGEIVVGSLSGVDKDNYEMVVADGSKVKIPKSDVRQIKGQTIPKDK